MFDLDCLATFEQGLQDQKSLILHSDALRAEAREVCASSQLLRRDSAQLLAGSQQLSKACAL